MLSSQKEWYKNAGMSSVFTEDGAESHKEYGGGKA